MQGKGLYPAKHDLHADGRERSVMNPLPYRLSLLLLALRLDCAARLAVATGRELRAERILERLARVNGLVSTKGV